MNRPRRIATLPLAFLVATLIAMVAVPIIGERYASPVRREVGELTEPARTQTTHLQLALALEAASYVEFFETRDSSILPRLNAIQALEDSAYRALATLTRRLGPEVQRRYAELRDLDERRHARLEVLMATSRARIPGGDRTLRSLYEQSLVAAAQLDETLNDATQARRNKVAATERLERSLIVALGVLALAAIVVVVSLGRRLQLAATEAEQRRRALATAVEARDKLMRGVSHDLKNPLNAIDGHAALIEDGIKGPITPAQKESIGRIRRAVQTQLALIGDLLELSQAEAGNLQIHKQATDVLAVVAEEIEEQRPAAEAMGHTLTLVSADAIPAVDTDPERVKQVLGNLLSNAIKYTPPRGRIGVTVESSKSVDQLSGQPAVAIRVSDSGNGIPAEKLDAIFQEFTRLEPSVAEGSGLGLAIARRISRLLGGDITVASQGGSGSVFSLWLPYATTESSRSVQHASQPLTTI